MNTREKLLGLNLAQETVNIDGITVIVKEMTAGEGAEYENSLYKIIGQSVKMDMKNARSKLIALTCYDEQGAKLFDKKDEEQVKLLPNRVAAKLFDVASRLNNLTSDGQIDVDGAVKN